MLSLTNIVGFNMVLSVFNQIPWTIIFIITQTFGIRLYYIKNKEECLLIQKRINHNCSHITDNGKGYGYSFGFWYALNLSVNYSTDGDSYSCYMISTESSFKMLTRDTKDAIAAEDINCKKYTENQNILISYLYGTC